MPRRDDSLFGFCNWYPVPWGVGNSRVLMHKAKKDSLITNKPERFLEPVSKGAWWGGKGLTVLVVHNASCGS
jgi:hypothetical protein